MAAGSHRACVDLPLSQIQARPISDFAPAGLHICFLKIDVEGFELVRTASERVLANSQYI
jgi:hypothetical protein